MDFSRFGDKKTHLTIKTLSLTYSFYIFDLTLSDGKLAITHEEDVEWQRREIHNPRSDFKP